MGWRLFRRTKLFGGIGINWNKSGPSLSVRTPFGTVSSKGISIRTGIKGLSFRISNSPKQQAGELFRTEFDITYQKSMDFSSRIDRIKRFNGTEIGYCMPNSNYNEMLLELEPLIGLGREIDAELIELQGITRQYRLGMMPRMNFLRKELAKLMAELETVWNAMYENKQQYLAENPQAVIAQPPPLPSAPPPLPAERIIRLNCFNCQQPIEVNGEAEGQSFDCPNCGSKLDVGRFEDYQTPAVMTEPPSHETITQPSSFDSRQDKLKKTLITIGSIAAVLVIGILLFILSINAGHHETPADKLAKVERQRKVDAVAERITEAQRKSDARAAEEDFAKSQIKLKDWSFSVTSEYHGIYITDGPVIVIKYELSNPSDYKILAADWHVSFYDANDNLIKSGSWAWPVSSVNDTFMLGFNNLQFQPARVKSMKLGLKNVSLSKSDLSPMEREQAFKAFKSNSQ